MQCLPCRHLLSQPQLTISVRTPREHLCKVSYISRSVTGLTVAILVVSSLFHRVAGPRAHPFTYSHWTDGGLALFDPQIGDSIVTHHLVVGVAGDGLSVACTPIRVRSHTQWRVPLV